MGQKSGESGQNKSKPCSEGTVTLAKVEEVIRNTTQFHDDDARTCFWVYVEGLNGNKSKETEFAQVLEFMKKHRPDAHQIILERAGQIIAL